MDSSPLLQLPSELLISITSYLEHEDLKSLRCTCHPLNTITLPQFFHEVHLYVADFLDSQEHGDERSAHLVHKYGHLIKTLEVDGLDPRPSHMQSDIQCPFEVHPYLYSIPNLQNLSLYGINPAKKRLDLFGPAYEIFENAGDIFPRLRSLTLDFVFDWQLGSWPIIFSMHIESLTMRNVFLHRDSPNIPFEKRGQSTLKSLALKQSYIDVVALRNILSLPKALKFLDLEHWPARMFHVRDEPWTPKEMYSAIIQQAGSLERIEFMRFLDDPENVEGRLDVYGGDDMYVTMREKSGGDFDLSRFPKLRVYKGFYEDSSGRFRPSSPWLGGI